MKEILMIETETLREERKIPTEEIVYQGLVITQKGIDAIFDSLYENNVQLIGLTQRNMHMTTCFLPKEEQIFSNKELGRTVMLHITAYGEYVKNNVVANQGLLVSNEMLENTILNGKSILSICNNKVNHITLVVNREKTDNGNPIGKASETSLCDFNIPMDILVEARVAVFDKNNIPYYKIIEKKKEKEPISHISDSEKKELGNKLKKEIPFSLRDKETYEKLLLLNEKIEIPASTDFSKEINVKMSAGAQFVIDTILKTGNEAFLVGGCVRDSILGIPSKDEDIATNLSPEEVTNIFENLGYHVIPTGLEFGTVTVMVYDKEERHSIGYEVTQYRIDGRYDDSRHPESVEAAKTLEEDLQRRDYTINAIAYCNGRIVDPFGGVDDLKKGIIRTVGNPDDRFKEDALRMMRGIRFACQKNLVIEKETLDSMKRNADRLKMISRERINVEITKILITERASYGIRTLHETGLLKIISPDLDNTYNVYQNHPNHMCTVGEHIEKALENSPCNLITRLSVLLHDTGKVKEGIKQTDEKGIDHFKKHELESAISAEKFLRENKFSKEQVDMVTRLVEIHENRMIPFPEEIEKFKKHHPDEDIESLIREKIIRFIEKNPDITPEMFENLTDIQKADIYGQIEEKIGDRISFLDTRQKIFDDITSGPYRLKDLAIDGKDIMSIKEDKKGNSISLSGKEVGEAKKLLLGFVLRNPEKNNYTELLNLVKSNVKRIKNNIK